MSELKHTQLAGGLLAAEVALRCPCDRPCLFVLDDDVRCLKCGRPPALRLGVSTGSDRGLAVSAEH